MEFDTSSWRDKLKTDWMLLLCYKSLSSTLKIKKTTWHGYVEGTKAHKPQGGGELKPTPWPHSCRLRQEEARPYNLETSMRGTGAKLATDAVFWGQWKIISSWRWAPGEAAWPKAVEREPRRRISKIGWLRTSRGNVKDRQRRQAAAAQTCLLDTWLKIRHYEGFQHPMWSMSQTTGMKWLLMRSTETEKEKLQEHIM